eukprot:965088_1
MRCLNIHLFNHKWKHGWQISPPIKSKSVSEYQRFVMHMVPTIDIIHINNTNEIFHKLHHLIPPDKYCFLVLNCGSVEQIDKFDKCLAVAKEGKVWKTIQKQNFLLLLEGIHDDDSTHHKSTIESKVSQLSKKYDIVIQWYSFPKTRYAEPKTSTKQLPSAAYDRQGNKQVTDIIDGINQTMAKEIIKSPQRI